MNLDDDLARDLSEECMCTAPHRTDIPVVPNEGEAAASEVLNGRPHGERTPVLVELVPLGIVVEDHLDHRVLAPPVPVAKKRSCRN